MVPREALIETAAGPASDLASVRYRAIIPMQGLRAHGIDASIAGVDRANADDVRARIADAAEVVFIKNYGDPVCGETLIEEARGDGRRVWFDLTDDRFDGAASEHLQRMVKLADRVVTVSATLQQTILQHTGKNSYIVGDPYEGPRGAPRWAPDGRLKALWFGNGWNLQALMKTLPRLVEASRTFPLDLQIVTGGVNGLEHYCDKFNQKNAGAMTLTYLPWSRAQTWDALAACDVVLIPALLDEVWTLAKSPNRIVESLWAGRFVVAHAIPSYRDFADTAWLGDDLADGIAWVMHNPDAIVNRIARAQALIERTYSPAQIAHSWERLFETA